MKTRIVLVTAALAMAVAACAPQTQSPEEAAASASRMAEAMGTATSPASKYEQTWPKQYSDTLCTDWQISMSHTQRWAAAGDILTAARNKVDGGTGLPPEYLVTRFAGDITQGCSANIEGYTILDVAYGIYELTGHDQYAP